MNRLNSKYGKTISRLLKCESNIIDLSSRISRELGKIERIIKFEGFVEVGLTPTIEISSGDEILILCKGYELGCDAALDIIELNGCIRPEDIPGVRSNLL
jgi:hypothetical protein